MTDQEGTTVVITEEQPSNTSPWLIALVVALVVLCCCCIGILLSFILAGSLVIDWFNNPFYDSWFFTY